jgi:hypothetical protein
MLGTSLLVKAAVAVAGLGMLGGVAGNVSAANASATAPPHVAPVPSYSTFLHTPPVGQPTIIPAKAPPKVKRKAAIAPSTPKLIPHVVSSPAPKPKQRVWPGPFHIFDSAQPNEIPANAHAVAGYDDGPYAYTGYDWGRFRHATKITIDILGGNRYADVEDVEDHGVPMRDIRGWAIARLHMHRVPVIYCSLGVIGEVRYAMRGVHFRWWSAQPNGIPHVVPGSVATQYSWQPGWDESLSALSPAQLAGNP